MPLETRISKAGSRTLRWAAVEAAQHAWRPTNPWHQLYTDLAQRAGKNPAKAAVARKILIAGGSDPRPFVGMIALGPKRSEEPYTPEDRELLRGWQRVPGWMFT